MEMTISELKPVLKTYIVKKKPLYIHGAPGIGKSDSAKSVSAEVAKEKGKDLFEGIKEGTFGFVDIRVSQLDPSDLRGIPFPNKELGTTEWLRPSWLPDDPESEGVLFLDEMNLAPPSIQAAAYQLILDRRLGDYILPDGWSIVAAGNRAIDKANVFPMSIPLKDRFSHAHLLPPSDDEWVKWGTEVGNIRSDILAFIKFKPSLLHKIDKDAKSDAFPTHRSWATASFMTEGVKNMDEEVRLVATCVGEGAANVYSGFIRLKNKVKIDEILKDPTKAKNIDEVGLKYTLISGLAEKYRHDRKLCDPIIQVVDNIDAEFGVFLMRMMKGYQKKHFSDDLAKSPTWKKIFQKYNKYVL
jgi:hypothetical protein